MDRHDYLTSLNKTNAYPDNDFACKVSAVGGNGDFQGAQSAFRMVQTSHSSTTRNSSFNFLIEFRKKKLLTLALAWRTFSFAANHNILCLWLTLQPKYLGSAARMGSGRDKPKAGEKSQRIRFDRSASTVQNAGQALTDSFSPTSGTIATRQGQK
ncbi:MAG TPA: hypothetical protein VFN13_04785 [Rudaea sp.]|nr:hypothetical protein [Rudaea sp.]